LLAYRFPYAHIAWDGTGDFQNVICYRLHRRVLIFCAGWASIFAAAPAGAQTAAGYTISTIAGVPGFSFGYAGDGGPANQAQFDGLYSVLVDSSGNLYIVDQFNNRIRKVSGGTINTIAGDGVGGFFGDDATAIDAEINLPTGVALDKNGNLYIVDRSNNVIRQVSTSGTIQTVAGDNGAGAGYSGDNAAATSAQLNLPISMVLDSSNNMYIADTGNNRIRKVTAVNGLLPPATTCSTTSGGVTTTTNCPAITTLAGSTLTGYQGDNGEASNALLNTPIGICLDAAGNVYFSDSDNHVIRKIATNGIITTVAGTGVGGFSGDGGPATQAQLYYPHGIAMDQQGNLYIADYTNQRIRKVSTNGIIETIAGQGKPGLFGDGGPGTLALLNYPTGVAVDSGGNVYIADTDNYIVRKLTPVSASITSSGVVTASAFGDFAAIAPGSWIEIYGSGLAIDTRSWETKDFSGVNAPTSLDGTTVTIGGQSAFVEYISPGQVNAQVPFSVTPGSEPLVVNTPSGATSTYNVTVNALEPGLVAPSSFLIGGKQYAVATFTDGVTYVLPTNAIPGVPSRPANPGDTIVLYGVGFGPVTPAIPAGQIVQQNNSLTTPVTFSFGGTPAAAPGYAGLAQSYVGLYQFNVTVPTVAANNLTPLTFTIGSTKSTQTLYIAIN
jgi:uncharacterized protein (TIGR03437 family)